VWPPRRLSAAAFQASSPRSGRHRSRPGRPCRQLRRLSAPTRRRPAWLNRRRPRACLRQLPPPSVSRRECRDPRASPAARRQTPRRWQPRVSPYRSDRHQSRTRRMRPKREWRPAPRRSHCRAGRSGYVSPRPIQCASSQLSAARASTCSGTRQRHRRHGRVLHHLCGSPGSSPRPRSRRSRRSARRAPAAACGTTAFFLQRLVHADHGAADDVGRRALQAARWSRRAR
jgi:hypothetical protein